MSVRAQGIEAAVPEAKRADTARGLRIPKGVLHALEGVGLWALIVLAFQQGLQRGIGFTGEEAAVLAGGLGIMAGVLVIILLGVNAVLSSDW